MEDEIDFSKIITNIESSSLEGYKDHIFESSCKATILHISGEIIIILGILMYYHQRISKLGNALRNATERYDELEIKIKYFEKKIEELI